MKKQIHNFMKGIIGDYFSDSVLHDPLCNYIDHKMMDYSLLFGRLVITHYEIFSSEPSPENVSRAAAAMELLILSIDIYDDLQDGDNNDAVWMKESPGVALNLANALAVVSQDCLAKGSSLSLNSQLLHAVHKYLLSAAVGQYRDIENTISTEEDYLEMLRLKSGSLTSMAASVGYMLTEERKEEEQIRRLSALVGIIGQIDNDMLAIQLIDQKSDMKLKKRTLPVFYLLDQRRNDLITRYYSGELRWEDLVRNKQVVKRELAASGAVQYTAVVREIYKQKYKALISELPLSKDQIMKLNEFV
ncbi:hypothetical protein CR205_09245 [Alteribacter lacisalsi]|uniref:Polyprenyl synthetase n=1 Tax=Alteribacter lacisalsi TaxID=2045244 RepID=A0A2W0HCZ9_9BACI|nr:class 1 isoprenoid biosynthesis enzyme [Alteribacter lacisalsi]PYZ98741.1 hypothetical protein CR205_09245 [Alteribacter lacisalsi]